MTRLAKLDQFITDAKTVKKNLRSKREEKSNEEKEAKNKAIDFTFKNVLLVMESLDGDVKTDMEEMNDAELLQRKDSKRRPFSPFENLSNKIK